MKFNVSSKSLYGFTSAVSKVIGSKNAMSVLDNFLFELSGNTLIITASDVENVLTAKMEVMDAEGEGKFCLNARRIVELLKEMPDQGITFNINDNNLSVDITYASGNSTLIALNGNEYPTNELSQESGDGGTLEFTCPTEQIMKGLENTLFAVGTDEIRPQMMGILWDIKQDGIVFVATDTRKLVKYTNRLSAPGQAGSFILPVKPANVLKSVFGKEETIKVTVTPKSATFESTNFSFNCRLIKGTYPDYNRVIPTSNPNEITVDRLSFLNACRRMAVFVDPSHGLVKFKISEDRMEMKVVDNNYCTSGHEDLPCNYSGHGIIIGFCVQFLIEIANTISTDDLVIKLSDPSRPGMFLPADQTETSELVIILMPMTVSEF